LHDDSYPTRRSSALAYLEQQAVIAETLAPRPLVVDEEVVLRRAAVQPPGQYPRRGRASVTPLVVEQRRQGRGVLLLDPTVILGGEPLLGRHHAIDLPLVREVEVRRTRSANWGADRLVDDHAPAPADELRQRAVH